MMLTQNINSRYYVMCIKLLWMQVTTIHLLQNWKWEYGNWDKQLSYNVTKVLTLWPGNATSGFIVIAILATDCAARSAPFSVFWAARDIKA